jgi:hypothetical protein
VMGAEAKKGASGGKDGEYVCTDDRKRGGNTRAIREEGKQRGCKTVQAPTSRGVEAGRDGRTSATWRGVEVQVRAGDRDEDEEGAS